MPRQSVSLLKGLTALAGVVSYIWPLLLVSVLRTEHFTPFAWGLCAVLGVLLVQKIAAARRTPRFDRFQRRSDLARIGTLALGVLLTLTAILTNTHAWVLYYPLMVTGGFFLVFSLSLTQGMSACEVLARKGWAMQHPGVPFPPEAVTYTRRLTQVWCGFFVLNGCVAYATIRWAQAGDVAPWGWWNGCLSYIAMGLLFVGEWLYRRAKLPSPTGSASGNTLTKGTVLGLTPADAKRLTQGPANRRSLPPHATSPSEPTAPSPTTTATTKVSEATTTGVPEKPFTPKRLR